MTQTTYHDRLEESIRALACKAEELDTEEIFSCGILKQRVLQEGTKDVDKVTHMATNKPNN